MASEKLKEFQESIRKKTAKTILDLMERDELNWKRDWNASALLPVNGEFNTRYKGINRAHLFATAVDAGYTDPRWITFAGAKRKGWHVKAGEKAASVEKWKLERAMKDPDNPGHYRFLSKKELESADEADLVEVLCLSCIFHVFNYEQLEGPDPFAASLPERDQGFDVADRLIGSSKCPVIECASHRACYSLMDDRIVLPLRSTFESAQGFTATLIHEMAHSTGHRSRLDREEEMHNWFGTEKYAIEELRAEFASAFVQAELGVDLSQSSMENHAAYLKSWLRACREDDSILFGAISAAEKISTFLVDEYGKACARSDEAMPISA